MDGRPNNGPINGRATKAPARVAWSSVPVSARLSIGTESRARFMAPQWPAPEHETSRVPPIATGRRGGENSSAFVIGGRDRKQGASVDARQHKITLYYNAITRGCCIAITRIGSHSSSSNNAPSPIKKHLAGSPISLLIAAENEAGRSRPNEGALVSPARPRLLSDFCCSAVPFLRVPRAPSTSGHSNWPSRRPRHCSCSDRKWRAASQYFYVVSVHFLGN